MDFQTLAQFEPAIDATKEILDGRSELLVAFAFVVICAGGIIGVYLWKIVAPDRRDARENRADHLKIQTLLAGNVVQLTGVARATHALSAKTADNTTTLLAIEEARVDALRKIQDFVKCDLSDEISKIESLLSFAKRQTAGGNFSGELI